jgi:hypothetical protein
MPESSCRTTSHVLTTFRTHLAADKANPGVRVLLSFQFLAELPGDSRAFIPVETHKRFCDAVELEGATQPDEEYAILSGRNPGTEGAYLTGDDLRQRRR